MTLNTLYVAIVVVASDIVLFTPLAGAHPDIFKALSKERCVPVRISVMHDQQEMTVYEVECAGDPPRIIGVACGKDTCLGLTDDEDDEDRHNETKKR